MENKLNDVCRPLQQVTTEIERAVKVINSKLENLKNQKDQRAFMQALKIDEVKSAIEKNRHL